MAEIIELSFATLHGATLHPAGDSRGIHAVPRAACCIAGAARLHQPALLAASVSGDALPGSARTDRRKHPGASLGACPGATRAARWSAGLRTALHYVRPAPVAASRAACRITWALRLYQPAPFFALVSGIVLRPASRRYRPCGVNPHRLGARGAGDVAPARGPLLSATGSYCRSEPNPIEPVSRRPLRRPGPGLRCRWSRPDGHGSPRHVTTSPDRLA